MGLMDGKKCLIMGVANQRSIAWGIAQALHREGAELAFNYATRAAEGQRRKLVATLDGHEPMPRPSLRRLRIGRDRGALRESSAQRGAAWTSSSTRSPSPARKTSSGTFLDIPWDGYALAHHIWPTR